MNQAAVAHIYLGRLDQPLAQIRVPGRQTAHDEQVREQIEIAGGGLGIHAQIARKLGRVEQPALVVSKHDPEATQGFGGDAGTKLRNIPLQVAADEILPPAQAARGIRSKQTFWKPAAHPEIVPGQVLCFQHVKRGKLKVSDPTGQAFTRLLEQIKGSGTEQKVLRGLASVASRLVNQTAQYGEKPRRTMDLVENHQLVPVVRKIELGLAQFGTILLGFEVEVMRVETSP